VFVSTFGHSGVSPKKNRSGGRPGDKACRENGCDLGPAGTTHPSADLYRAPTKCVFLKKKNFKKETAPFHDAK
jgi:hypothetical protein